MAYGQPVIKNDLEDESGMTQQQYPPWSPEWNVGVQQPTPPTKKSQLVQAGGLQSYLSSLMGGGRGFQSQADPLAQSPMSAPSGSQLTPSPAAAPMGNQLSPSAMGGGAKSRGVSPALSGVLTGSGQAEGGNNIQAILAQLLNRRQA